MATPGPYSVGKSLEHLSGFLEVLERILDKKRLQEEVENIKKK